MSEPTHGLFDPDELRKAVADARNAGQRAVDLIEMVIEHQTRDHAFAGAAAASMADHVDHAVRRWLDSEVIAGTMVEADGRYYMVWTKLEFQTSEMLNRADQLDGVAGAADRVNEALAELAEAWTAAGVDSDPLLRGQLNAGYPFPVRLDQLAGKVRRWADNVHAGVGAAVNEPHACAAAIRQHLKDLQPRLERDFSEWADSTTVGTKYDGGDPLSNFYEASIRNGLGGIFGDVAASASPAFMSTVADLLDHIADNPRPHATALAERVAAAYRSSRSRDDERHY